MKAFTSDDYANLKTVTGYVQDNDRNTTDQTAVYEYSVMNASKSPLPGVLLTTKTRLATVSAVCLGLLCVLLLAGIIGLWLYQTEEANKQEKTENDLQTSYNNLTKENDQLHTINQRLTAELKVMQEMANSSRWYKLGFSWYYNSTELKTWNQSRQDCLSRGADLVIINSRVEEEFINSIGRTRVWLGLTDIEVEGTWKWVDGTLLNKSLSFWRPPQPDNGGTPWIGEEDCGELNIDYNWNDVTCNGAYPWMCEKMF